MTEDEKRKLATRHASRAKEYMLGFEPVKELRVRDVDYLARLVHEACYAAVTEALDATPNAPLRADFD